MTKAGEFCHKINPTQPSRLYMLVDLVGVATRYKSLDRVFFLLLSPLFVRETLQSVRLNDQNGDSQGIFLF